MKKQFPFLILCMVSYFHTGATGLSTAYLSPELSIDGTVDARIINGSTLGFHFNVFNSGQSDAENVAIRVWLSKDDQISPDDARIYNNYGQMISILAGDTLSLSYAYLLRLDNTMSGANFIIAQVDPLNLVPEANENDNIFPVAVQIEMPQPPESCTKFIGEGDILCLEKNGDFIELFVEQPDEKVQKYQIDSLGNASSDGDAYLQKTNLLFVQNDSLIKRQFDGTIVFKRPIPSEILDTLTRIDRVIELNDNEYLFAGYARQISTNPSYYRLGLNLIKTNSDLSILQIEELYFYSLVLSNENLPDRVLHLDENSTGEIELAYVRVNYVQGPFGTYSVQDLGFKRLNNDLTVLTSFGQKISAEAIHKFEKTPCGSFKLKFSGLTSSHSSLFAIKTQLIGSETGIVLYQSSIISGIISRFGYMTTFSANQFEPEQLKLSMPQYRVNDPLPPMNYVLPHPDGTKDSVFIDFFPFQFAARTGEHSLILFGKTNDSIWVNLPHLCSRKVEQATKDLVGCEFIYWNSEPFFSDTVLIDTVQGLVADTILTVNISILGNPQTDLNIEICRDETFEGYTEAGSYEDVFLASNGCDSIRNLNLTVHPNPITTNIVNIASGDSLLGIPIFSDTTFVENLQSQFGCDSTIITIIQVSTTEVENFSPKNLKFTIYPNPHSQEAHLSFITKKHLQANIQLFDALGNHIFSDEFYHQENNSNYSIFEKNPHLPKGIYFLKIETEGQFFVEKIIRQ